MKSPMGRAVLIFAILAVLTIGVLIYQTIAQHRVVCEVCITFHGRTACREAAGPTREDAVRTATNNTCAFLASGMTDSVSCGGTPPTSVRCEGDGG